MGLGDFEPQKTLASQKQEYLSDDNAYSALLQTAIYTPAILTAIKKKKRKYTCLKQNKI